MLQDVEIVSSPNLSPTPGVGTAAISQFVASASSNMDIDKRSMRAIADVPGQKMTGTETILGPLQGVNLEPPPMWHVMIKNDDFTTFIFVIEVLIQAFGHAVPKAEEIAQEVHDRGKGSAGVFTRDVAETKANQVMKFAEQEGYPLKAVIEQAT